LARVILDAELVDVMKVMGKDLRKEATRRAIDWRERHQSQTHFTCSPHRSHPVPSSTLPLSSSGPVWPLSGEHLATVVHLRRCGNIHPTLLSHAQYALVEVGESFWLWERDAANNRMADGRTDHAQLRYTAIYQVTRRADGARRSVAPSLADLDPSVSDRGGGVPVP
jgi:hypothetical protein